MKALIFIPGYKGSFLRCKDTKKKLWMPFSLMFKNNRELDLPLENVSTSNIESCGTLKGIPYLADVYSPILNLLKKVEGYNFFEFHYDWRLSVVENSKNLYVQINSLRAKGFKEFNYVAHSMGGLILGYYLKFGNQPLNNLTQYWSEAKDAKNAIFCATPFKGTLRALEYMLNGNKLLFNKTILDSRTALTFPVAYEMLPFYNNQNLYDISSKEYLDVFDVNVWKKYKLGLFSYSELNNTIVNNFVTKTLENSKKLLACINYHNDTEAPGNLNVLNLVSNGYSTPIKGYLVPTLNSYKFIGKTKQLEANNIKENTASGQGDNLVFIESGAHPFKNQCKSYTEKILGFDHKKLYYDSNILNTIKSTIEN